MVVGYIPTPSFLILHSSETVQNPSTHHTVQVFVRAAPQQKAVQVCFDLNSYILH